jgi:hypothetical protein
MRRFYAMTLLMRCHCYADAIRHYAMPIFAMMPLPLIIFADTPFDAAAATRR